MDDEWALSKGSPYCPYMYGDSIDSYLHVIGFNATPGSTISNGCLPLPTCCLPPIQASNNQLFELPTLKINQHRYANTYMYAEFLIDQV